MEISRNLLQFENVTSDGLIPTFLALTLLLIVFKILQPVIWQSLQFIAANPIQKQNGFTLIELLVVIVIIAILAIMGFAAFGGVTGRGNDDRRQADIKAISDSLEVRKGTNTTYQSIFATDFSAGVFPSEPTNRVEKYCYVDGTSSITNPAVWITTACPAAGGWTNISGAIPAVSGTASFFKICTINEAKNGVICRGSRQ